MAGTARKRIAHKIELHWDRAGGNNFTRLCNVKKITGVGFSLDAVDFTCLEDEIMQNAPSPVLNLGDLQLEIYWDDGDADHQAFEDMVCNPPEPQSDPTNYPAFQIRLPFATPIAKTFHGWLKDLPGSEYEVKTEIMRQAVVNVNTKPVTGPVPPPTGP